MRLPSRSLGDFIVRGGWIWTTQRHLAHQAHRYQGGFLVGHTDRFFAGCAMVAQTALLNWRGKSRVRGASFGSVRNTSTWDCRGLPRLEIWITSIAWVLWAATRGIIIFRRPKRQTRATAHHSAGSPVLFQSSSQPKSWCCTDSSFVVFHTRSGKSEMMPSTPSIFTRLIAAGLSMV